jgi:hypothetical protein
MNVYDDKTISNNLTSCFSYYGTGPLVCVRSEKASETMNLTDY